ncbi:MAG: serine/threonine protein kinase, partial [Myxococcales bacterium]|nr:serine/threonine protein kinase [Myxococcales bacterium]
MADDPQAPSGDHSITSGGSLDTEERTIGSDQWPNPAETSELPNGASLGRYTILRRLGAGAMGVVYSAFDPELDRKVAIKILHPRTRAVGGAEEGKLRLVREAKALARLSHPNVVAIHDVGTIGERVFIAMEFVDGQTLGAWLKAGPRTWREVLEVLRHAGEGLGAAHRAGLIHRDFKPENVVIARDGRVRVLDFGLARASGEGDVDDVPPEVIDQSSSLEIAITSTGVLVGTPAYMAPEQHIGRPADARSDQFSFCITLYQALYGERPYAGENLAALQANVIQGRIRPAPAGARVPSWLHRIVLRGLSVDPEARFPSVEALVEALRRDPSSVRMRWLGVVGLFALIIGIVVGVFGLKMEPPCAGAGEDIAEAWNDAAKEKIRGAFAATNVPYAATAWKSVEVALDAFAGDWRDARREACLATHVRHEHSEDLLDRRMFCLDRARANFEALISVFGEADTTTVERAVEALDGLDDLRSCDDLEALMETVPLPSDPAARERIRRIRLSLAEAKALDVTGKWELAGGKAEAALAEAKEVGYRPVSADALLVLAGLKRQQGEHEEAMD